MLALLRNLPSRSSASYIAARHSRHLSCTAVRYAKVTEQTSEDNSGDAEERDDDGEGGDSNPKYDHWLASEGKQYMKPHRPRNWLGGQVPYPLNPSFKPPTPVSDELRTLIYTQFMANPSTNGVRTLAERYGLSMKRVDAILRLKGLEEHWKKGKPLQTGFQDGMEFILGVKIDRATRRGVTKGTDELGMDTSEADRQAEVHGNDVARDRYQRMFWEPVVEGKEPLVLTALDKARAYAAKHLKSGEDAKSDPKLLAVEPGKHAIPAQLVTREGRPAMKFVDVGGKFLDVNDRVRRMKEGERRSKLREKRRDRKSKELEAIRMAVAH